MRLGIGAGHAHGFVGGFRRRLGVRTGFICAGIGNTSGTVTTSTGFGASGSGWACTGSSSEMVRRRRALRGAARKGSQQDQRQNGFTEIRIHGFAPSDESSSRLHDRPLT